MASGRRSGFFGFSIFNAPTPKAPDPSYRPQSVPAVMHAPIIVVDMYSPEQRQNKLSDFIAKLNEIKNILPSGEWSFADERKALLDSIDNTLNTLHKTDVYKSSLLDQIEKFEKKVTDHCNVSLKFLPHYKYYFHAHLANIYSEILRCLSINNNGDCHALFDKILGQLLNDVNSCIEKHNADRFAIMSNDPVYKRAVTNRIKSCISEIRSDEDCRKCFEELRQYKFYLDSQSSPKPYFTFNPNRNNITGLSAIHNNDENYWTEIEEHFKEWVRKSFINSSNSLQYLMSKDKDDIDVLPSAPDAQIKAAIRP